MILQKGGRIRERGTVSPGREGSKGGAYILEGVTTKGEGKFSRKKNICLWTGMIGKKTGGISSREYHGEANDCVRGGG